MSIENRRSERITDYLPLKVHAVQGTNEPPLAGPFSGRIIDISPHGACLLMTQVLRNGFHIFHSTRETDGILLQLTINDPPDLNHCILTAAPIWLGFFQQQEIRAYKMGIEFTQDPKINQTKELWKAIEKNQKKRGNWWQEHCKI
jgi:hypothetical protein